MLLLVIPAGFLVDHFGSKKLFLTGSIAGTLITFSLMLASAPIALAALLGLAGLFSSLKMTALNASFFRNLQTMGLDKAGWFKGSMSIGLTFIGPLLGGYLVRVLGFGVIYQLLAWLTLIPVALVFFFHNEPVRQRTPVGLRENVRTQLKEFRKLIGRRSLYLPLLTESLSTACFSTFSTFIVVIAVKSLHLQPTSASVLMTVEGGVFILTVFAAGPLIKILSSLQLYLLSVTVTIVGLVGLSFAGSFQSVALVTVVLGLGLGLLNLVTSSRIGLMEGEKGKIVSLFAAAVGAGISLGPMLGGLVGQFLGTRNIFLAFVPLFLFLALAAVAAEIKREDKDLLETTEELPSAQEF
jgi:predicted MFS family arabinose efflux permease